MMGLPGCGMGGGVQPLAGYAVGGVMPVMLHDFVTGLPSGRPGP
ncbi:hypothetical protein U717_15920 [Rhodobacter capsulatus R121]|uniref:Uncharacterized protein n=1 Tax=Rhodobacter capsulatus (strain ATCC BAA-309 / NBRC 16581 / SB1003) TaxID=272942 RepID=D5APR2_RHOCB|nr:hypothetical protein RCAP_rcc02904 [Rhodobacter capsulatus SB 1003]ETD00520.1 hypothetical protein U714_15955 [Rhodobacter capsulatus DE442]ETD74860.1 hypothetical protein U717_15920 [Rhodobacter capsulatus R121]ETE52600.1 hypothetical protein U715_15910 [Rhodobacter capsulatus Y262]